MDMKINSQFIIEQRKIRAWSQQHLADVAQLSLRTVQRIENSGSASPESIKAISAVLELLPQNLILITEKTTALRILNKQSVAATITAMFISVSLFLLISLYSSNTVAESGFFRFTGEVRINQNETHAIGVSIAFKHAQIIQLDSSHSVLIITPDSGDDYAETEVRLLQRKGAVYSILHRATVIGSSSTPRFFSYRICGDESTFYNSKLSEVPTCD